MQYPVCRQILRNGHWSDASDRALLNYEQRFLRRTVLATAQKQRFLVDLARTTSLDHGDAFELEDGRLVEVIAADEHLMQIAGDDLLRYAWHIGNRHTPCQIEAGRLLVQRNHVIRDMLQRVGATVTDVIAPFTPEGGAYGHGRTHGHAH